MDLLSLLNSEGFWLHFIIKMSRYCDKCPIVLVNQEGTSLFCLSLSYSFQTGEWVLVSFRDSQCVHRWCWVSHRKVYTGHSFLFHFTNSELPSQMNLLETSQAAIPHWHLLKQSSTAHSYHSIFNWLPLQRQTKLHWHLEREVFWVSNLICVVCFWVVCLEESNLWICPKWHPIHYIVHLFWPEPHGSPLHRE